MLLMRTPGRDPELVRGLLLGEGVLRTGDGLPKVYRPEGLTLEEASNVMAVDLSTAQEERWPERSLYANASCGVCGRRTLDQLATRARAVGTTASFPPTKILGMPALLRQAQSAFHETGGLHAAGLFNADGNLMVSREDVGRHNAVDKVIGWAWESGKIPWGAGALCVSGRTSYEIVQKAITAGIPVVVAVSAPSSLAVDLAERFQVTLCGFVRDDRFNIYSHGERITSAI